MARIVASICELESDLRALLKYHGVADPTLPADVAEGAGNAKG